MSGRRKTLGILVCVLTFSLGDAGAAQAQGWGFGDWSWGGSGTNLCSQAIGTLRPLSYAHLASHQSNGVFPGDGINAGMETQSVGRLSCMGEVEVDISNSWDWGSYRSAELDNGVELERHPCALMNTTGHTFSAENDILGSGFTTTASVTVRDRSDGEEVYTLVRGGSVCEIDLQTEPVVCTTNETTVTLQIAGGTGRFEGSTGYGLLHSVFNFCTNSYEFERISLYFE